MTAGRNDSKEKLLQLLHSYSIWQCTFSHPNDKLGSMNSQFGHDIINNS